MKRVLSIASLPPWPPGDGLHTRTWNLLVELAKRVEVQLATWADPAVPPEGWERIRAVLPELDVLPWAGAAMGAAARAGRQARFFTGGAPPYIQQALAERGVATRAGRERFAAWLGEHHARRPFDAIVLEDEAAGLLPLPALGVPVAAHRLNVFSNLLGDLRRMSRAGVAVWPLERAGWARFDREALRHATVAIAPTEEVRRALEPIAPGKKWAIVPNGIALPANPVAPGGGDVVFVGWMGYPPNVDAARWFVWAIWPAVRAQHPRARLRIIGRAPTPAVRALASVAGVEVTGEVPEIAAACAGAAVGVVPLRAGMGIKNKTLELMALGLPVVATTRGAEGIAAAPEDGMNATDDAITFAGHVARLLADPARAAAAGCAARRYVERHHSWAQCGERYAACLEEAMAPR